MDEDRRPILVPLDCSSDLQPAIDYATDLARERSAEIVLVHVVEPLPRGTDQWCDSANLCEQRKKDARHRLERFEKRVLAQYPRCRTELRLGSPAEALTALACELNARLIVISVNRRVGILDRLLEGLPERLMRSAPCPVFAVQLPAASEQRLPVSESSRRPSHLSYFNFF
jgi:nucleotide-binding universal stress UspA family protein